MNKHTMLDTPIGQRQIDTEGAPVGIVRLNAAKANQDMGKLLQKHINGTEPDIWKTIRSRIDYMFEKLDLILGPLEKKTCFQKEVRAALGQGKKIFFKPNLVNPACIHIEKHSSDRGTFACSEWSFVAAVMRWFHDKMGVQYSQMAIGEAATSMSSTAGRYSMLNSQGKRITTEAVIEGKDGDFYCGWGFYFVRKYLTESLPGQVLPEDDPMRGYEESLSGIYIPPGRAGSRLLVYDLNRIADDPTKGRDVPVPDGEFFKTITIHKAVVGGDPADPRDRAAYPGCFLVNIARLKVHTNTLLTNAIKNLGIGLYPMESARTDAGWDYSLPRMGMPGIKGRVPHQAWIAEEGEDGMPKLDADGNYIVHKTGGITAAMIDIIQAVRSQGNFMLHVTEAIETINLDHQGVVPGSKHPEGLIFAALDPVALDLAAGRYLFCNVGMKEAEATGLEDGYGGRFPQRVPIPTLENGQIVTGEGYDCPVARDHVVRRAEARGLGLSRYYVFGVDEASGRSIVSVQGRIGTVDGGRFEEIITPTLYFDIFKFPWDMQQTFLHYLDASDRIGRGASRKKEFLEAFDEKRDGTVNYEEFGKKGHTLIALKFAGSANAAFGSEILSHLKAFFLGQSTPMKCTNPAWNMHGHHACREFAWGDICMIAWRMSQTPNEMSDLFVPGLTWGNRKWPSFELAQFMGIGTSIYGLTYPMMLSLPSLYGLVFMYADCVQNGGRYLGNTVGQPKKGALENYLAGLEAGGAEPLDFMVYVPPGFDTLLGKPVPHVASTTDPKLILTATVGLETWKGI